MAEFVLDYGTPKAAGLFRDLDAFTQGYIEAIFFTDASDDDELKGATFADLAPVSLAKIVVECIKWQSDNRRLLDLAYRRTDYNPVQAGRDYWFTRNGHGAGFWDRDTLKAGDLGDALSAACRHSSRSVYLGDDKRMHYDIG